MRSLFARLLLVVFVCLPAAFPQTGGTSTIRGFVRDQGQAVIPGATVTLTNVNTNVARTSQTNESGLYVFPGVIPGSYRLTGEFAGMQKFEGTLTVQTGTDESIEIMLKVASATTSVEVADVTAVLDTDNATVSATLERQRIEAMPVLGRSYLNMLQTVPSLIYSNHGHQIGGRALAYGLQVGSTFVTMDGNPMTEEHGGWDFPRTPDLDTIQEIHVETNNSSARYSKPTTIIMSSRSGTNQLHGAVFYDNRNSAYGLARARQDPAVLPYNNRNEYGLSIGGPVSIPKVYNGKNRTFWFYSWEGTRSILDSTQQLNVPTAAMMSGDFRGLTDNLGRPILLYDPNTTNPTTFARQQFQYNGQLNVIDPARLSPTAKFLFAMTKAPTNSINPALGANWIGFAARPLEQDAQSLRIDHRISDKDLVYGRYATNTHFEGLGSNFAIFNPIYGDQPTGRELRWWPNHEISATWMHTVSATTTNELQVTGTRDYLVGGSGYNGGWPVDYAGAMGLPNPFVGGPGSPDGRSWPNITVGSPGSYGFGITDVPQTAISDYITFQDNVTKVVRKHELAFGFQYRWYDLPKGQFTSSSYDTSTLATSLYDPTTPANNASAVPLTGANIANLFIGSMNYSALFQRPVQFMRKNEYATYIQDNFKVSSRLTLNLGLRWEVRTPMTDKEGTAMSFDLANHAYVLGSDISNYLAHGATVPSLVSAYLGLGGKLETYQQAGLPSNMVNMNWKQFGPRLGFAYKAFDGKKAFVLRGGFRISYYPETTSNIFSAFSSAQILSGTFTNSVTNTALSPDGLPNYGLRSVPQYVAGLNTPSSIININNTSLLTPGSFTGTRIDPNLKDPKVYDWNMTIEKEVMPNTVARFSYLGNHTVNQSGTVALNSAPPTYIYEAVNGATPPTGALANVATRPYDQSIYGNVGLLTDLGFTWYNGFEMGLERRYSKGFSYQIFWDMANAMVASGSIANPNQYLPGSVPTDTQALQRFLNYHRDVTASFGASGVGTPHNRVRWNSVTDLPIGRGKKLLGNTPKVLDKVIGGWQVSNTGFIVSAYQTLPSSEFPTGVPLQYYGYKYPIQDCTSGTCYPGYLWYNGYIPLNQQNSVDANGKPNGIEGLPANYQNAMAPLIPYGSTALPPNAPANTNVSSFWNTNTVWVPLKNGTVARTTYSGLVPFQNQEIPTANQWFDDAGLTKAEKITERITLRLNIDFLNIFNHPNNPVAVSSGGSLGTPTISGILSTRNSGSTARITQLSARFTW